MNEDPDMSRLYREAYGDIKAEKEHDYNESKRIHDKYSYIFDGKSLKSKIPTDKYSLKTDENSVNDEVFTTELSDEGLDLVYKRYKILQAENSDVMREVDEEAREFIQNFNAGKAKQGDDAERQVRSPVEFENELGLILNKRAQRVKYNGRLETFMAQIRYVHALKHMNPLEVYNDKDPVFPGVFPLNDTRNAEKEMVGVLPEEIRKIYDPFNFPEGQSG